MAATRNNTKRCAHCHQWKQVSEFNKNRSEKDRLDHQCRECRRESKNRSNYRRGIYKPLGTNRECACYLGVHVAERVLSHVFEDVQRMPHNNPGFDFICRRGYKIDVKSSCRLHREGPANQWYFNIYKNTIADYFLCLAFDDRKSLNPEHVWLIPGADVNDRTGISITESCLEKWDRYELPGKLDEVVSCCNVLKAEVE